MTLSQPRSAHYQEQAHKGGMSGIAGKIFAAASAAALCVPLLGLGQAFGIMPGGVDSNHYADIESLSAAFNRPAYSQTIDDTAVIRPVGPIQESFSGGAPYHENKIVDTAVGFGEAATMLGTAGVLGAAGSAFADVSQRRRHVGEGTGTAVMVAGEAANAVLESTKPFMPLFAMDALRGRSSDASKAVAAGMALGLGAIAVALPTYLSGKSVYDNYIRKAPSAARPG
jgi:hypothetical protein